MPKDPSGKILLKKDDKIQLACTDQFGDKPVKLRLLACTDGNKFYENGTNYEFKSFNCKSLSKHIAKRSDKKCFNDATVIDVGFQVDQRFYKSYEVCFDEVLERTHYVKHEFTAGYKQFQKPTDDKWSSTGYFKDKDVDKLYIGENQKKTVAKILNSDAYADGYINIKEGSKFRLNRGHLAARTDFVFANNQRSTYWFMNAAPQWQIFNDGNWNSVEIGIKNFVADKNLEVDVYTGTYGTTTLWDEKNKAHEIYLYVDETNIKLIPAPKIFYKIMVDRKTQNGIVFIGVNNPYLQWLDLLKEYILCPDVSNELKWVNQYIKWQKTNITLGYSYACDVNQFMTVVKHLPDLKVTGLLNSSPRVVFENSLLLLLMVILINLMKLA